jgi:sortase A
VGLAIVMVGIFLGMLVVYLYAFSPLTAARDQHRLATQLATNKLATFALVAKGAAPEGSPVGLLKIPTLHLDQVIVEGTSAADLEEGPGHMPGTAFPGAPGNAVLAGRRVTFGGPFHDLAELHRGDSVKVTDGLGTFLYRVRSVRTVAPGQPDVVGPSKDNRLTLVTSSSAMVTDGRLVVTAGLRGLPVDPPGPATTGTPSELALSGDPSAGGAVLLWVELFVLVGAATVFALWRWRRPRPTYALALPILLACGLFAAEAVARCLPATL